MTEALALISFSAVRGKKKSLKRQQSHSN